MKNTPQNLKRLTLAAMLLGSCSAFAQSVTRGLDEDKSGAVIILKKRVEDARAEDMLVKEKEPQAHFDEAQIKEKIDALARQRSAPAVKPVFTAPVAITPVAQAPVPVQIALPFAQAKAPPIKPIVDSQAQPPAKSELIKRKAAPVDLDAKVMPPIKVRSMDLPGVGTLSGSPGDYKIKTVRVGSDRNERVYIALGQLNKIATPFDNPQAVDSTGATLKTVGQDVYIQPVNDKPLTLYITNGGVGQSIGLTLVPQTNLPAQSIVIQPDSTVAPGVAKADEQENVPGDYVSRISSLIKQLTLGKTPAGFNKSAIPRTVVSSAQLVIEPLHKFSGSTYDLFSYKVRSISSSPIEMSEESFYSEPVRAVAFYPSALLQAGEETNVFVIADRSSKVVIK